MPSSRQDFDRIHEGLRERARSMQIPELAEAADEIEALRERLRRFDNLPRRTHDGSVVWDLAEGDVCGECGRQYGVWWTEHPVWNEVVGGCAMEEASGMLCPSCFVALGTAVGMASRWKIMPDDPICAACGYMAHENVERDIPGKGWVVVCADADECARHFGGRHV